MTTFITIIDDGSRRLLIKGNARSLLRSYRHPATWSNIDRGWRLDRDRLADFLAQAQEAGAFIKQVAR